MTRIADVVGMAVSHAFPASAAKSLVEGYCEDFVSLAASLAQTLEQMEMRGLDVEPSREVLVRTERGMRGIADAIHDLLARSASGRAAGAAAAEMPGRPPASAAVTPAAAVAPAAAARPATRASSPVRAMPAPAVPPLAPARSSQPLASPPPASPPLASPPPAARPEPMGEHKLKGTNATMPVLSVFQFLSRMRKSGTLHIDIEGEHLTFDFVNGTIEASNSDRSLEGERLGDILLQLYPAHRERLEPFLQRPIDRLGVRRLGTELVQHGLVSNGQVIEALEKQVVARFHRVSSAPQASYAFDEGERVPGDGRIRIRPFELVFASRMQGK
jgi:hypothetical protein